MAAVVSDKVSGQTATVSGNNIVLSDPSTVTLQLSPNDIAAMNRSGNDLVIDVRNGQDIRIENFYGPEAPSAAISSLRTRPAIHGPAITPMSLPISNLPRPAPSTSWAAQRQPEPAVLVAPQSSASQQPSALLPAGWRCPVAAEAPMATTTDREVIPNARPHRPTLMWMTKAAF